MEQKKDTWLRHSHEEQRPPQQIQFTGGLRDSFDSSGRLSGAELAGDVGLLRLCMSGVSKL